MLLKSTDGPVVLGLKCFCCYYGCSGEYFPSASASERSLTNNKPVGLAAFDELFWLLKYFRQGNQPSLRLFDWQYQ